MTDETRPTGMTPPTTLRQLPSSSRGHAGSAARAARSEVTGVRRLGGSRRRRPTGVVDLAEVTYADGDVELYQVPLALYADPEHRLDHAFVGWWEDPTSDGPTPTTRVHDREAMACGCGVRRPARRPAGVPPAAGPRARPDRALDAVHRRAVQLLGGLRRGGPAEGLPPGHAGDEPRHRDPRGAHPRRVGQRRGALGWVECWCPTGAERERRRRSSWRCCSSSCAPPATAGSWR